MLGCLIWTMRFDPDLGGMNLDNTLRKRIIRNEGGDVMKLILLLFTFLFSSTSLVAQQLPEWYRVYTFDESIIEMNTSSVIIGGDIGRVTFRWTFDRPEVLNGNPKLTYKTRLESIEFRCTDGHYRYY